MTSALLPQEQRQLLPYQPASKSAFQINSRGIARLPAKQRRVRVPHSGNPARTHRLAFSSWARLIIQLKKQGPSFLRLTKKQGEPLRKKRGVKIGTGLIYCVSIRCVARSWRKTTCHGSQRTAHGEKRSRFAKATQERPGVAISGYAGQAYLRSGLSRRSL